MHVILNPSLCAGGDLEIVNAARRSFDTQHQAMTDGDERLIRFLIDEGHWLPFRHPQLSFTCSAPIFVARQLGKHQVGLSWSEVSRRYKTEGISFFFPDEIRGDHSNRKQGRGNPLSLVKQDIAFAAIRLAYAVSFNLYLFLLWLGVTPEQARMVLPQGMNVYWTWTGSLMAWLHLVKQRTHKDAQAETEEFVRQILPFIAQRFPTTWAALCQQNATIENS